MQRFVKALVALLGLGAALVGAYAGAAAIDQTKPFWIVVPVCFLGAAAYGVGPRLLDYANRIRNYQRVLQSAAEADVSRDALERLLADVKSKGRALYAAGFSEGQARALGAFQAVVSGATLVPEAVSASDGLVVTARLEDGSLPDLGARFSVKAELTGDTKGILEVVGQVSSKRVTMACVAAAVPEFWRRLAEQAITTPAFPHGFALTPAGIPDYSSDGYDDKVGDREDD